MKRIRAIYIPDINYKEIPIFELKEDGYFRMINDEEMAYEKGIVFNDEDWVIFEEVEENWIRR
ncbi:MAG: hypothetical protein ACRCX8_06740 [Sarcina sp.]